MGNLSQSSWSRGSHSRTGWNRRSSRSTACLPTMSSRSKTWRQTSKNSSSSILVCTKTTTNAMKESTTSPPSLRAKGRATYTCLPIWRARSVRKISLQSRSNFSYRSNNYTRTASTSTSWTQRRYLSPQVSSATKRSKFRYRTCSWWSLILPSTKGHSCTSLEWIAFS